AVVALADSGKAKFQYLYPDDMPLWEKVRTIAQRLYGASEVEADKRIKDQLADFEKHGFGHFPVCIAKTQYSFSIDANLKGAPSGARAPVSAAHCSAARRAPALGSRDRDKVAHAAARAAGQHARRLLAVPGGIRSPIIDRLGDSARIWGGAAGCCR